MRLITSLHECAGTIRIVQSEHKDNGDGITYHLVDIFVTSKDGTPHDVSFFSEDKLDMEVVSELGERQ